jgi:hypothetical protein
MDINELDRRVTLIEKQLSDFIASDKYIFEKHLQMFDGKGIQTGRTTGTRIATASDQLLGFYGLSPVDQPAAVPYPTGGGTVDADARQAVQRVIDRLRELGLIAT